MFILWSKSLLAMLVQRLQLKSIKFSLIAASDNDIYTMWSELLAVDSALNKDESLTRKSISSKHGLAAFLKHCCTCHHY